jgi:XTP/dITP diphosphohydrolase
MTSVLNFATHNRHKADEIALQLKEQYTIKNLHDLGFTDAIAETGSTLRENAMIKARFLHKQTGMACFSDDTGLMVDSLSGEPGVYSARYAGVDASAQDNMVKLLAKLRGRNDRKAQFKTVIAFVDEYDLEYYFEGVLEGEILTEQKGDGGFGYDPVFRPLGFTKTLAEVGPEIKGKISHRALAVKKFITFLRQR